MIHVLQVESTLMLIIEVVLIVVKLFAFVSSLLFSAESYNAANKLTKPTWTIILGLGLAAQVILGGPIGTGGLTGIISLVFTIAAFVYLADVRPALNSLTRR